MRLDGKQHDVLCIILIKVYVQKTNLILERYATDPKRYIELSNQIGNGVKPTFLREIFKFNPSDKSKYVNRNIEYLNSCALYAGFQSIEELLNAANATQFDNFSGIYRAYWFGTEESKTSKQLKAGFTVTLSPESVVLESEVNGMLENVKSTFRSVQAPIVIQNKGVFYVELEKESKDERVYLILHIGDGNINTTTYIPGIFASCDLHNMVPCCGPILLVQDNEWNNWPNAALKKQFEERYGAASLIKSFIISAI